MVEDCGGQNGIFVSWFVDHRVGRGRSVLSWYRDAVTALDQTQPSEV